LRREELEEENRKLMSKFDSLSMEIGYLKKLWEEVEKARTEQHVPGVNRTIHFIY